jgi:hypothetical protein
MWQDGRDAGVAVLCTRNRTRTGRTELRLTRSLSRFTTVAAASPRSSAVLHNEAGAPLCSIVRASFIADDLILALGIAPNGAGITRSSGSTCRSALMPIQC